MIGQCLVICIAHKWSAVAQLIEHLTGDRRLYLGDSPPAESVYCVLEQDTLSAA